ncbi:MAG: DUF3786 domain-containing protein [Thermodesulfobacteriota bacterium]
MMQPLEFVKLTPMSNCGECGYGACLAFAAAVTKGGEQPFKCPYLDHDALPAEFADHDRGQGGLDGVAGLLDEKDMALVAYLKKKTGDLDFSRLAEKVGCSWSGKEKDTLLFDYLGQAAELSHDGILLDGIEAEDPRDQILLYNYIHFGGGDPLTNEWIGMESMANSISKVRTLKVYCEDRIASFFSGKEQLFHRAVERIGGTRDEEPAQSCTGAYFINLLPRLSLYLLFWDEDVEDQFPAQVKLLFDRNGDSVLDIESLVFCGERLAENLEVEK